MAEATIASFILRFTQEHVEGAERPATWRGVIRHVQTHEEAHFTQMEQALAFIAHYVAIAPEEEPGDLARTTSPT
jgi:hypothetical protein